MDNEIFARIISRHDSSANWNVNKDFILLEGEIAFEFDETGKPRLKVGDGKKTWEQLEYFASGDVNVDVDIDEKIANAIANLNHLSYKIVGSTDDIDFSDSGASNYIYLITKDNGIENTYEEYMVINGALERVGSTQIDLSDYAKIEYVNDALASVVKKQEGKGLSANDFTNELLAKLNGIANGAQPNIIDAISVAGIKISPQSKVVNIPVATTGSCGVVKGSTADNKISVAQDGTMTVNSLTIDRLANHVGTWMVMRSGNSKK